MTQPRNLQLLEDPEFRAAWEAADEQDRLRDNISVAELVEQDKADPTTPDHFEVELTPFDRKFLSDATIEPDCEATEPRQAGQSWNVTAMRKVAALLRSWGWTVLEMPGWETRGVPGVELRATETTVHHTGAATDIDRILRDGRSDLRGPLCNFAVHFNSDIVLVAAGKANHAGVAVIDGSKCWGIESTGPTPITAKGRKAFPNYRAQVALCVAIRIVEGWPASKVRSHSEIARPDGRKWDPGFQELPGDGYPAPYPEMDRFRRECSVTKVLRNPAPAPKPVPKPPVPLPTTEDDEMLLMVRVLAPESAQRMYFPATGRMVAMANQDELQGLATVARLSAGLNPVTGTLPTVTVTKAQMAAMVAFSARLEGADDAGVVAAINKLGEGLLAELNEDDVPEVPVVPARAEEETV